MPNMDGTGPRAMGTGRRGQGQGQGQGLGQRQGRGLGFCDNELREEDGIFRYGRRPRRNNGLGCRNNRRGIGQSDNLPRGRFEEKAELVKRIELLEERLNTL